MKQRKHVIKYLLVKYTLKQNDFARATDFVKLSWEARARNISLDRLELRPVYLDPTNDYVIPNFYR